MFKYADQAAECYPGLSGGALILADADGYRDHNGERGDSPAFPNSAVHGARKGHWFMTSIVRDFMESL